MIRGIHHIAMHTPNFEAMKDFYRKAFGFEPIGKESNWKTSEFGDNAMGVKGAAGRSIILKGPNCYLELFEFSSPPPRAGGPARPNDHGYTHFSVEVTDIEQELERLKAIGMTFMLKDAANLGLIKTVYGRDPDGNIIEIQQTDQSHPMAFGNLDLVKS